MGTVMTASRRADPDIVSEVLVELIDISEFDERPTVNIRRPRLQTEPDLANADPDGPEGADHGVITSAARVEDLGCENLADELDELGGSDGGTHEANEVEVVGWVTDTLALCRAAGVPRRNRPIKSPPPGGVARRSRLP